jgi:hypothetical protein
MSKSGNLTALSSILSASPADRPTLYYAEDPPYLPRILIFYWPVQGVSSFASTSRVRLTILSAAGFKAFTPFSIAPSSAYYSAVHKLSDERQRDEVSRAIAFGLFRYFSEVPADVKNNITDENLKEGIGLKWGQTHAAQITSACTKVTNTDEIIEALRPFSKERPASPATPVRPLASIRKTRPSFLPQEARSQATPSRRTPSSQARRTPSNSATPTTRKNAPTPVKTPSNQNAVSIEKLESLRFKMCEFVDTEDRYINRLQELIELVTNQGRTPKSLSSKFTSSSKQKTVNAMIQFPSLLDTLKDLNIAFLDDIEGVLQKTEDSALAFIDQAGGATTIELHQLAKDPIGVYAFAKVLLTHFPKFLLPYRDYLDLHSLISSNLDQYLRDGTTSIQTVPSLLMEPAQRISRYGLYIDTMLPHVPSTSTMATRTLEKARKIIAEICEMEPAASTILDSLRVEHEAKRVGLRAYSPTKLLGTLTRTHGSVREAPAVNKDQPQTPRLFHSLGRSLSRKNKSRAGLNGILSEHSRTPSQQAQTQISNGTYPVVSKPTTRGDENRPPTSSSNASFSSISSRLRPQTATSQKSAASASRLNLESIPSLPPTLAHPEPVAAEAEPEEAKTKKDSLDSNATIGGGASGGQKTLEHYKAALMRVEEENYKLLQENAELKRQVRECSCGRVLRSR